MLTHFRQARNLRRFNRIVAVLARHGFGSFLEYLQVDRYLPVPPALFKKRAPARPALSPAQHFRIALEELGPTFIKLGQVLSTRADLFPPQYIFELSKLQEGVPPTPWEVISAELREEYGRDPDEIFDQIDPVPLGSASLAQVHAAVMKDGSQVVLKVLRPNIRATVEADLEILRDLASLAQRTSWGQLYNPIEIVEQFAFTLHNELDFRREGLNADRFRKSFSEDPNLYIPKVYWEVSTPHVLVLERLYGIKISAIDALKEAGFDGREVARHAGRIVIQEIMADGFFHADPHPGNFVVMAERPQPQPAPVGSAPPSRDGGKSRRAGVVIGAMDFGMVGHLSNSERMNLLEAYLLSVRLDAHALVDHMVRIGAVSPHADLDSLEKEVERMLNTYSGLSVQNIQLSRVIEELMHIAFQYQIDLPADLWLLFKTLVMMEGLARRLDPEFNLFREFQPHITRLLLERRMPWVWGPKLVGELESLAFALKEVPSLAGNVLRSLQHGELPFSFNVGANKETLDRLDRVSTRFSLSLLIAAFILGLALLLPLAKGNHIAIALVAIGFVASLLLGVWLVVSILRSGK